MEGVLRDWEQGMYTYTRPLTGYGGSVTGFLLTFPEVALVVDTLCSPNDMAEFRGLIGNRDLTVVYTHSDWDHCLGTAGLSPCLVVGHELARKELFEQGEARLAQLLAETPELVAGASVVSPDTTFSDRLVIGLGNLSAEAVHLPGHTADSSVVWIPHLRVLVAGDAVEDPFPSIGEPLSVGLWADALDRWGEEARLVVPGHGEVGGPELIRRNARYLRNLIGVARRSTPYPVLKPDTSLWTLDPASAKVVSEMEQTDQDFYHEVHRENVRKVTAVL